MVDYLDEIVGQETAKQFIRTALKSGNLYNFLLCGPKGVGKRLFAFALAKLLNCPYHTPDFILITPIPSKIKEKKDKIHEYTTQYLPTNSVVEVEDRASILIEQIRDLIERLIHMPSLGAKRVVLILEADRMTDEAANCFLKTLEEPPLDTVFILTTSRPNFLLPTIHSRCQKVPFTYLNNEQIKNIVFEGHDEFQLGSPGEILMLQQNSLVGNVFDIFIKAPLDIQTAATLANDLQGKKLMDLLYPLLLFYRLIFYQKMGMAVNTKNKPEIIKKANNISFEKIIGAIMLLNNCINSLDQNPNRLLLLFNVLIQLP